MSSGSKKSRKETGQIINGMVAGLKIVMGFIGVLIA